MRREKQYINWSYTAVFILPRRTIGNWYNGEPEIPVPRSAEKVIEVKMLGKF
jgi:hypothetical protein